MRCSHADDCTNDFFNDGMQMKVSNRQVMHVFSPVALSFPVAFQCKLSQLLYPFVFFWLLFTTRQVSVSLLDLPQDKRKLVISVSPAFAWP
jgi:hypothetical protein